MIEALIHELKLFLHELREDRKNQRQLTHQLKELMSAIQDQTDALTAQTAAVSALTVEVAAVVAALSTGNTGGGTGATDAQLAANTAKITANTNSVTAAIAALTAAVVPPSNVAPTISAQPGSVVTVPAGGAAVFNVTAAGSPPLSYQWQFNGTDIPGETGPALTINNAQQVNVGSYTVIVTNSAGSVTSDAATLALA